MASGLQSRVEDHSNITMLNLIAYPIFSPWYWLHPHPPQKQQPQQKNQGQSISIAISFRRAQLSVIYSTTQKWKAKLSCFKMDQRWGKCIPPTTLVWYYTKWLNENTNTPIAANHHHQAIVSCVVLIHTSEWGLLYDSIDFGHVYFFFFSKPSVNVKGVDQSSVLFSSLNTC